MFQKFLIVYKNFNDATMNQKAKATFFGPTPLHDNAAGKNGTDKMQLITYKVSF